MATAKKATRKKPSSVSFKAEISDDLKKEIKKCSKENQKPAHSSTFGFTYFLGFLGSTIYYISTATGFWMGLWGVVKSLVWPAILVFELMRFIGI